MKEIEVTLYSSEQKIVTIDPEQIDFIHPGLGQTFIHYIDGPILDVVESEKELTKRIRESEKCHDCTQLVMSFRAK